MRDAQVTVLEDEFRMAVTRHRGSVAIVILTGSDPVSYGKKNRGTVAFVPRFFLPQLTSATPTGQDHWCESTQTSLCLMRSRSACGSSLR
jgi:hypothetical protein